jgi:sec-independent protein translocase protein TatA
MRVAGLGPLELLIVLIIVLLLFGVGRISNLAGELGKGIRAFREGIKGEDKQAEKEEKTDKKEISS